MKSVIDRIENIEKRNSLLMNIETKKTKIITKEKKKRKVYPDYRRVSQFDLIPKFKKKIIKKKFLYSNKKTLNNSPINLIKNHFVISRNNNINNMGYLFKSILNQKKIIYSLIHIIMRNLQKI